MKKLSTNFISGFICLFSIIFLLGIFNSYAQVNSSSLWTDVNENLITDNQNRQIIPQAYRTLSLNLSELETLLNQAPLEFSNEASSSNLNLELPLPYGGFAIFNIVESPIMEPALAEEFPQFKTYLGYGLTEGVFNVRFDFTPSGFHAMIRSVDGTIYIDPYSKGNIDNYISYYKKDYVPLEGNSFLCEDPVDEEGMSEEIRNLILNGDDILIGEQLRTYRLALAATGEYTSFHGGTVIAGMNAIVVAMNRVNQIYENEVAIRMILVANNDTLVFTNSGTDPYTNNNGSTMLGQNQSTVDARIGNTNYDVGHVFSTGGGGIAGLGVICRTGQKARGVTGLPSPIGDPFYVDYVAHEMGHQFGANHSFNGDAGSCGGGNRNASTAFEPGSGATIMAYAGICGSHNLQSFSDDYFHGISFDEIVAYTNSGFGNTCAVTIATGNNAPVVTIPTGGFNIPISTPFTLTGSATDPNGDPLTYSWEEFDLGPAGHPNSPSGNAPIFRSFDPVTSPSRTFPKLSNIINNNQTIGEIMPSYSRFLTFRLTARDNRAGGGGVAKSSFNIAFNVTNTEGPFLVTSPNTAVSWPGLSNQTVTWNVANTNSAPVNCANVNILLSTDGGQTFPITILTNTPNDGSEEVTIPDNQTTTARIKIQAVGNIFFDMSNANFTISEAVPVELATFNCYINSNTVTLNWITASEINNNGFDIQRSKLVEDNQNEWQSIGFVNGNGTTTESNFYTYSDEGLQPGNYLYRLKIIDNDGSFEFSNEINITVDAPITYALSQNYPNPFNPTTLIQYQLPEKGFVTLKVYDAIGVEVETLVSEVKEAGIHEISFDATSLTTGVYFYTLSSGNFVKSNKMILLK
ncbi:MAG TPA: zinc-dependent metalloprotease family protein [Ignavibacteriaceae bacterium]|nr:zinc-dependent metalloprotease family protein [Ignavibacteriaceae bacterium]